MVNHPPQGKQVSYRLISVRDVTVIRQFSENWWELLTRKRRFGEEMSQQKTPPKIS
jgi:hypothetical protein